MTDAPNQPELRWELFIRKRPSATQGVPPGKEDLTWVANTVTLLWGQHDAVLVDTFLSDAHNTELADWIESKGRNLRTIYLTHAHPDHFFGLTMLLRRFPEAQAIAVPNVVAAMRKTASPEELERNWKRRFPGLVPEHLTVAKSMTGNTFELERHVLQVIEMGHTDTDDTTGLYVPSLGLLIAGDVVYNEAHPFLVETDTAGRQAWLAALDKAAVLYPTAVIVGHGPLKPDNSPTHIEATRRYILDFDRLDQETETAEELYHKMLALYPNRINPGSLWGSAHAAKKIA
ncbi:MULTISPECIES: MBL fold metallo-hydrolase [unclassified Rhizobium]|uniref:MBL fold metallo-hydrolase n=1 Tax=unclassified Rhizobium TaxID=2613769 RepID=UPI001ADBADC9|nr:MULTISPECIES: MBL fold metallo-hydrolase [unclassified Rhizobium]MBO9128050.1 MBL fold metallo-hydrolase [Rhizobium sp. 16-488-2b]MBO9178584.1 MBL fold metallo-hydrolase [Rhizobium sp. 16-488-2a]